MAEQNLFQNVLDDDEQVIKTFRPLKGRAWFSTIFWIVIWSLVLLPAGICAIIYHTPVTPEEDDTLWVGIAVLIAWFLLTLISLICIALWCHKTVYALTSKRVLIRTGYIGIDYKSLDFSMVGALAVNVNVVDKLLHRNTGTVAFGSMASPMVNSNGSNFRFAYVRDPYQVYKEIKFYIDQKKTEPQK